MLANQRVISWQQLLLILLLSLYICQALRCRSEDGPSEADMKRVIRSCMRRVGANVHGGGNANGGNGNNNGNGGGGFQTISNTNFHYGQHGHNHQHSNNNNNNNNNNHGQQNNFQMDYGGDGFNTDEDDSDEYDSGYGDNVDGYYQAHNTGGSRDLYQQKNHERNPILNNRNNANSYGKGGNNGGGNEARSSGSNSNQNNNSNSPRNSNTKSYGNGNARNSGDGGNGGSSGHNGGAGFGSARNFNNQNNENNRNNNGSSYDTRCIVHCFFEEMNMLNHDDYPDKHKVHYLLTKDMRSRELRSFYADTIQSCYRYLESQRRRDKCQFSRELVQCMAEYAQANCDDWEEFNVMFN